MSRQSKMNPDLVILHDMGVLSKMTDNIFVEIRTNSNQ